MVNSSGREVKISLLGAPKVEVAGAPVALPRRRTRSLLYFLTASPGQHGRDELVDLLWPNLTPSKGRRQLSDALSDLRRTLGADALESDGERVALALPGCDVDAFLAAVDHAGRLHGVDAEAELSAALAVYGGEFLAGVTVEASEAFEEWVQEQRLSLSIAALGSYATLATLRLDAGDPSGAIKVAQRGLELDNLREDLWRALIQARADMGDRQGALAEYRRCKETLHRELGVSPEAQTEALRRRISAEPGTPAAGATELRAAKARPPLPFSFRIPASSLALVGRERELATLLRAWESACEGTGGFALVAGEPGIGKTRLAAEFGARAAAAGAVVLAARCPDLRDAPPFGPIEEAIREVLPSLPPGGLHGLGPEWLPWIGRLLPELSFGVGIPEPMQPEEERARLAEGAGQLLDVIAGDGPLLLTVEDVHWAHPATLQLLHSLVRRRRPLLVLATMRDTEPRTEGTQAAGRALADLEKEGLATTVALGALGPGDTETLVKLAIEAGSTGRKANVAALARLAEGQPLFALELTRAVLESPDDPELPESLANTIASRINRASDFARRVLELAAVFGRPVTLSLLGRAVGVEPSAHSLVDAGDELIARRLLQEDDSGGLSPTHSLIRAAVYNSLSVSRRRALHARAAAAIESGGETAAGIRSEVLARHYRLAGDLSHAADHLLSAGERAAALREVDTAAARFRTASELFLKAGKEREAALALERSGKAVWTTCSTAAASAAFTDALQLWAGVPNDDGAVARLQAAMAQMVGRWGIAAFDPGVAQPHVEAAIQLTEGTTGEDRSLALSARSFVRASGGDLPGAEADARAALDFAQDSRAAWHSATDALAFTALMRHNWQEGLDLTAERIRRAELERDPFEAYDALGMATVACTLLCDMDAAEEYARQLERTGFETGYASKVFHARTQLAEVMVVQERWAEAEELLAEAAEPDYALDAPSYIAMRDCLVAELAARRGDAARARELLRPVAAMKRYDQMWHGRVALAGARVQAAIDQAAARKKTAAGPIAR